MGHWRSPKNVTLTEDDVYDQIALGFEDLLENVVVRANTGDGDMYEQVVIYENGTDISVWRNENYCMYYYMIKCICIKIPSTLASRGIQVIELKFRKISSTIVYVSVIAPGDFYSQQRKQNSLIVDAFSKYRYNIFHSIHNLLPKTSHACQDKMNWGRDKCKLAEFNKLIVDQFNCTVPWLLRFTR